MISFRDIDLSYGEKPVFRGFSLEVARGEKAVLLGGSGLGKSSLFYLLLGFERPLGGDVFFDGVRVGERTVWDVRRKISFVDQDVSLGNGSVSSLLDYVSGLRANAGADFSPDRLGEVFELLELGKGLLDENIERLSGGERQRIAIAVSLLLGREVFLLDEAASSLDRHLKRKTADYFLGPGNRTVLAVSHDEAWLEHPGAKVFDMGAGRWIR